MDAIGAAVNIISLIQVAKDIALAAIRYSNAYKAAPKDIANLQVEMVTLVDVLERINDEGSSEKKISSIQAPGGPLWLCQDVLGKIKKTLGDPNEKVKGMKKLMWPFKEDEIKDHLSKLERAKSVLLLSLSADQSTVMKEVEKLCKENERTAAATLDAVQKLQNGQDAIVVKMGAFESRQTSNDQKAALKWLHDKVDFEMNHKDARKLHQPKTCDWFVGRENGDFEQWLTGDKQHIWLHGIPGAGKTVLMSTVIAKATERLQIKDNVATAYFYFSFREVVKQKADNMLASVLAQLSRQVPFPSRVMDLHGKYGSRAGRPGCPELLEEIEDICAKLDHTYIFLDALDECNSDKEQTELLESIEKLCRLDKLNMIITSRKEIRIEDSLKESNFHCISIQNEAVNHDVRTYVSALLEKDTALKRHNQKVKGKIMEALIAGSQGMFRWVECQIDGLRKCRTATQILSILATLPKTLYSTYERILTNIPEEDREFARRALAWLIYTTNPLFIEQLAEATILEPGCESLSEYDRLGELTYTPEDKEVMLSAIEGICGSLVRREKYKGYWIGDDREEEIIVIAHNSVQEYLTSGELSKGKLNLFSLGRVEGQELLLDTCLTYLQLDNFDRDALLETNENCTEAFNEEFGMKTYPLHDYCAHNWHKHIQPEFEDTVLAKAEKLLDSESPQYLCWVWAKRHVYKTQIGREMWDKKDIFNDPLFYIADAGDFPVIIQQLIDRGKDDIDSINGGDGGPIHTAIFNWHMKTVKVLVDAGADLDKHNVDQSYSNSPLYQALTTTLIRPLGHTDREYLVGLLIAGGANLELVLHEFVRQTVSSYGQDEEFLPGFKMLLDAGVDINNELCADSALYTLIDQQKRQYKRRKPDGIRRRERSELVLRMILLMEEHGAKDPNIKSLDYHLTMSELCYREESYVEKRAEHLAGIISLLVTGELGCFNQRESLKKSARLVERVVGTGDPKLLKMIIEKLEVGINWRTCLGDPADGHHSRNSALHFAIYTLRWEVVDFLLDLGASVTLSWDFIEDLADRALGDKGSEKDEYCEQVVDRVMDRAFEKFPNTEEELENLSKIVTSLFDTYEWDTSEDRLGESWLKSVLFETTPLEVRMSRLQQIVRKITTLGGTDGIDRNSIVQLKKWVNEQTWGDDDLDFLLNSLDAL